ncbi:hypothetical protein Tco_0914998 [Tanacetum coccineum]
MVSVVESNDARRNQLFTSFLAVGNVRGHSRVTCFCGKLDSLVLFKRSETKNEGFNHNGEGCLVRNSVMKAAFEILGGEFQFVTWGILRDSTDWSNEENSIKECNNRNRLGVCIRKVVASTKTPDVLSIQKIKNPTTIGPTGHANTISPAEATLNWQSENAVAQNKVLVKILPQQGMIINSQEYLSSRVRSLESIINELRFKIQELH